MGERVRVRGKWSVDETTPHPSPRRGEGVSLGQAWPAPAEGKMALIAISDHLKIGTSDYFLSAPPLPYYA